MKQEKKGRRNEWRKEGERIGGRNEARKQTRKREARKRPGDSKEQRQGELEIEGVHGVHPHTKTRALFLKRLDVADGRWPKQDKRNTIALRSCLFVNMDDNVPPWSNPAAMILARAAGHRAWTAATAAWLSTCRRRPSERRSYTHTRRRHNFDH